MNDGRDLQKLVFRRADRKPNYLRNLRRAIWMRDFLLNAELEKAMRNAESYLGRTPDLDSIPFLYRLDDSVTELPRDDDEQNVFRVLVDGVVVRFHEESDHVRAVVEGRLSHERLQALQESVRNKLSTLEGTRWEIETSE